MNRSEYAKLSSPFLSHLARSMYLFAIKPNSDSTGAYSVDYATLIHRLSVYTPDTNELQYKPSTEEITGAIENLIKIQLIRLDSVPCRLIIGRELDAAHHAKRICGSGVDRLGLELEVADDGERIALEVHAGEIKILVDEIQIRIVHVKAVRDLDRLQIRAVFKGAADLLV